MSAQEHGYDEHCLVSASYIALVSKVRHQNQNDPKYSRETGGCSPPSRIRSLALICAEGTC